MKEKISSCLEKNSSLPDQMGIKVRDFRNRDQSPWDDYVSYHNRGLVYHLSGWKRIIERTYRHKTYYLLATRKQKRMQFGPHCSETHSLQQGQLSDSNDEQIVGVLPMVRLKHFLFGNSLVSISFFDLGGILADDRDTERALFNEAVKLGLQLKVKNIELRHIEPLTWLAEGQEIEAYSGTDGPISYGQSATRCVTKLHKVRMLLRLPESPEMLMKSFKAKLRSQIKKPIKEGLTTKTGGIELLGDFYKVFSINMRDLGSPVHSKKLMQNVLEEFQDRVRIFVVYKEKLPLASSLVVGFKDTLENPWASALREYSRLAPNMLLYWTMLQYACEKGYRYFDFGRSSPEEGTYKFKHQWGAEPTPLHWHDISLNDKSMGLRNSEKSKFDKAIQYWQKLPVSVTKIIGPQIRKHIGL